MGAWTRSLPILLTTAPLLGWLCPPAAASPGSLLVYLAPLPQDAGRLEFRIDSLAAVGEEGSRHPLQLALSRVAGGHPEQETRLASGTLPAGRYSGLEIQVSAAGLRREAESAELLTPSDPLGIPLLFRIEAGRGRVLNLRLDYGGSVDADFLFAPVFVGQVAPRPPVATLGLASVPESGAVTLFDKATGSVVDLIPVGRAPMGLALDRQRRLAYVAASGDDSVVAIGLLEARILSSVRLRGGDQPTELALTPDGSLLLCANTGSRTVSLIDALSMVEVDRFTVGDRPRAILVDRFGARGYVFNTASSAVTVLDIPRRAVLGQIGTDAEPFRGQLSRSGNELYVIHRFSPHLTVIDTSSLAVSRRIFLGSAGAALKVDSRSDLIYVAPHGDGGVDVYDPLSSLPVDSIPTESGVSFLALDGEESHLLLALPAAGELRIVRLAGKATVARVDLGGAAHWIALAGER